MRLYQRLLREARAYWAHIAILWLVNLLAMPIALLAPIPLKIAVDSIIGVDPLPRFYTAVFPAAWLSSTLGIVIVTAGLLVGIGALDEAQSFGAWLLETYTGERLVLDFRARLFRHVQRLSLTHHDTMGTGDSTYRIQYDAPSIENIAVAGVMPFLTAVVTLVAMIVVIQRIDGELALVALAASPLLFWVTRASVGQLKGSWKQVKKLESAAMSVLQEVLGSIRVVKAFSREDYEEQRFVDRSRTRLRELMRVSLLQMKFDVTIAMIIAVASAITLSLGIMHVKAGTLKLGSLLLVLGYLAQLYNPLRTMSKKISSLQSSLAGAERAFALLDEVTDVAERPDARPLPRATGAVEFKDVSFSYAPDRPVLHGVSFTVPAGACVGVAGATGAGKTTLLSLLTRFYDPVAGQVLLDGVDLRDIKLVDLRRQFAIVQQEPVLFSSSVADNIAYAKSDASHQEIEDAARAANAHDFIVTLPGGYDTLVGERGMQLSGGERQRIALARAFLRDAPLLLLDEPTSSVDVQTESVIMDALTRLMTGRTTFLIAHRLSTLEGCDIRMTIDGGRLASITPGSPAAQYVSAARGA